MRKETSAGGKTGKAEATDPARPGMVIEGQASRVEWGDLVAAAPEAQIGADGVSEGGGRGSGFAPPPGGGESSSQVTGDFRAMGPFAFRERDVAEWLGMPLAPLKNARAKKPAGVELLGGWVMYDTGYLEGLLLSFGLAEKTPEGLVLIEGLAWEPLLEKTRAWVKPGPAAGTEPALVIVGARVVRHVINPFLFLAEIVTEGELLGRKVNVKVKRKEERQKFKPGTLVSITPLPGRPVWAVVKAGPDVKTGEPQNTQKTQKGEAKV